MEALVRETKLDRSQVITPLTNGGNQYSENTTYDGSTTGETVVLANKTRLPVSSLGVPLNSTAKGFFAS